jgi:hypothetical protein
VWKNARIFSTNVEFRFRGFRCRVSGVRLQKKADRLGSYKPGKLEGLKARKLPGFSGLLASQPSSYEL